MSTYNIIMLTILTCNIIKLHVSIIISHVDINKPYVVVCRRMPLMLVTTVVVNLYFSLCSSMLSRQYSLYSPEVKKYSWWRSDLILFKQIIIFMLLNKSILPVVVNKHNRIYSKNDTIINILLCFLSSGSLKSVHEALHFDCQCHGSCIWS